MDFARCLPFVPHLITGHSYCFGWVHRATKHIHNSYFPAHKRKDLCRSTCRLKTVAGRNEETWGSQPCVGGQTLCQLAEPQNTCPALMHIPVYPSSSLGFRTL